MQCMLQLVSQSNAWLQLTHLPDDTAKVNRIFQFARTAEANSLDTALLYYQYAKTISEKINYSQGVIKYYFNYSYICNQQGKIEEGLKGNLEGLSLAKKLGDSLFIINSQANIAASYIGMGDFKKALPYSFLCADYYEKHNRKKELLVTYSNLAATFNNMVSDNDENDLSYRKSIFYYQKAYKIAKELGNTYETANLLIGQANVYVATKNYDQMLRNLNEAEPITKKENSSVLLASLYASYAAYYNANSNYVVAEKYGYLALTASIEAESYSEELNAVRCLSRALAQQKKHVQSKLLLEGMIKKAKAFNLALDVQSLLTEYINCCEKLGDYKSAFFNSSTLIAIRDSLSNAETLKNSNELDEKYQSEKKEILLQAASSNLEKEEEKNKRKTTIIWLGSLALVGTGFFAVIAFVNFRKAKRANEIIQNQNQVLELQKLDIAHQKELVDEKQKEIIDSINYAKRIQNAVLTDEDIWKKISPDYFILFKPKDIVSGDFYWAYNMPNGRSVFAVADCTGHGVPGGFMSMLGNSFLNELVIENKLFKADVILNKLRDKVIQALEQKGKTEQKDGMDICLCVWNKMDNTLEFSGANNPLLLIRNNALIEYKANKMPIGVYAGINQPFTSQTITLQKGDTIYLSSDGYADQFGGLLGKKYKSKQFENFLVNLSPLLFANQKELLDIEFESWKGKLEQLDDVCVLGIKV
jgi:serine phosphatase RsbU (regulator of sigma subunit)